MNVFFLAEGGIFMYEYHSISIITNSGIGMFYDYRGLSVFAHDDSNTQSTYNVMYCIQILIKPRSMVLNKITSYALKQVSNSFTIFKGSNIFTFSLCLFIIYL